ncbi:hypothetical protein JXB22_09640 [candidate division WOR-3 bacterium]|nr:hypothetical protein [candidate division WOR-3 bacterium]
MSSVSVKRKHPAIFIVLLCTTVCIAHGDILLGIGSGIRSYPNAFDPYDHMDRDPVLYPQGEMRCVVSDRISIGCVLSRTVVYGALDRYIDTPQQLTIVTGGFYGEFDLAAGSNVFGVGAQVQSIMGTYHAGILRSYDNGFGVKVYGIVQQNLFSHLSGAVRTGVQREWIRPLIWFWSDELQLDSFTIDLTLLYRI